HRLGVALATGLDKGETLLDVTACGTNERAPLEARDRHTVVRDHVHQDHLCITNHATHRTHSEDATSAPPLSRRNCSPALCCRRGSMWLLPDRQSGTILPLGTAA